MWHAQDTIIYVSVETVVEKVKYLEETTGADSLILHFPPYNSRAQNARVLRRFAEDVIPKFLAALRRQGEGVGFRTARSSDVGRKAQVL